MHYTNKLGELLTKYCGGEFQILLTA